MGDARFEQKVPSHQIVAASKLKKIAFKKYFTICFASIGKQEFTIISEIIRDLHEKYKDIFLYSFPDILMILTNIRFCLKTVQLK